MIEEDRFPIARAMTIFTLSPICPFMFVLFFVAGITLRGRIFKGRREVATLALYLLMFSHEREPRLVMIERRLLP